MPVNPTTSPLPVADYTLHSGEVGSGQALAVNTEGIKATYSAAAFAVAPPATPTDFWVVIGAAGKVIRVTRLAIAGRATAATWYRLSLLKYGALFTGGTSSAITAVPHDSADTAASATVKKFSVLPTVGATLYGAIQDDDIPLNAAALTATQPFQGPPTLLYDFTARNGKAIVLRGAAEYIALNGNGVALPTGIVLDIKVEWTEE